MTRLSLPFATVLVCIMCSSIVAQTAEPSTAEPNTDATASQAQKNTGSAQQSESSVKATGMPIYVTPYYNSKGPQIKVGKYSKELTSATDKSIVKLAEKMKVEWATLPVETMYVMSVRLYDLGRKDDAVYWFYSAQLRSRLFQSVLPKEARGSMGSEGFERVHAQNSFYQLAGTYINGYAFGELEKFQKTIRRVKTENKALPKLSTIYPKLKFIDQKSWPEQNKKIMTGLDKLLEFTEKNADVIKTKRKENGIEGKY